MVTQTPRRTAPAGVLRGPEPRRLAARQRAARLHLFTFVVGNALVWALWAAISVTAERWYWWPLVPTLAWALVLAAHLRHAYRPSH
jgi:hypothetical protein